jgi:4-alpha-glucanotransferase
VSIDRLAAAVGIEPAYRDYFGRDYAVSRETKLALLDALGIAVDGDGAARAALTNLEAAAWQRTLEPAAIVRHGEPAAVPVTLRASAANRVVGWRVTTERGKRHEGRVEFATLPLVERRVVGGKRVERRTLTLPTLALGYHRLEVGDASASLIVAPARCYLPPALRRGKLWGLAVQLYGVRSRGNWGSGDFSDLARLARIAARAGAAFVGINPVHALDPAHPDACSPYSPSSRLFLNVAYLDVAAIEDFAECAAARRAVAAAAFVRRLEAARAEPLVDYARVWALKRPVLQLLYASFTRRHLARGSARAERFRAFVTRGGPALERLCAFEARADGANAEFAAYLQWNAALQLERAAAVAGAMPIGLYRDLAVGAERAGAEACGDPSLFPAGVSVGAPPDALNVTGQNWNLAPFAPLVLRERAFAPFIALLQANMRRAGALRIDHAMGLARLFWIPAGRPAREGAYVGYPFEELLAIVALESVRNRCLVIGEDLGTVPDGFRERMHAARAFSSRLLYFERTSAGFAPPSAYPALALAAVGTHDLPTLPAFLGAHDVALRAELDLLPPDAAPAAVRAERRVEVDALLAALTDTGDLERTTAERVRVAREPSERDVAAVVLAAYRFLARARSRLVAVSLEDALGVVEQPNVPGTVEEHPNWRRRLPLALEALARAPRFAALARALSAKRPAASARGSSRGR